MRHAALLCLLPLALAAQDGGAGVVPAPQATAAQELGSIEGQLVNAITGEPVKKANVVLLPAGTVPTLANSAHRSASDSAGKFVIQDIEPGVYRLTATRTGFVNYDYGSRGPGRPGTTTSLSRGQKLTGLVLRLTPNGVITGRVVDEDGDPVAAVQMQLARYRYVTGRKQLAGAMIASTNDLGEYRLFGLVPGKYYLSANYRAAQQADLILEASGALPEEDYAPTYFPGTSSSASAIALDVTPGGQLNGINLTLLKSRTVRVKGRVDSTAVAASGRIQITVALPPRAGIAMPGQNRAARVDAAGQFELRGVFPGSYTLSASVNQSGKQYSARQPLEVGSGDIEGLTLTLGPGITVTGSIHMDVETAAKPPRGQFSLESSEPGGGRFVSALKEDGTFQIDGIPSDHYDVSAIGLPDGFYLKSVRSRDLDLLVLGLDLASVSPAPLEVVISPNAGQITGAVVDPNTQQPAPAVTVVLIPQEKERRDQHSYYKTAITSQSGGFSLKSISPGEYKAYAWDDLEPGAYMDPDFLKPFESKGEAVSVPESGRALLQLTLIAAEASQ